MTLHEIADLLAGKLSDLGLEAYAQAHGVPFDARSHVCNPSTLLTGGKSYTVSTTTGVTGLNPRGVNLTWRIYEARGHVRVVGEGRAKGAETTLSTDQDYTEVWAALETMLAVLRAWHKEIYGCWSRLEGGARTIHEWMLEDLAARQKAQMQAQ